MGFKSCFVNSIKFVYIIVVDFLNVKFLYFSFSLLILSGDVELNPGPLNSRARQCRLLYCNVRGLHKNIQDLAVVSRHYDVLCCSETLVSNMRHVSELLIPGFRKPIILRRDAIPRARGMALYVRSDFSAMHKTAFECKCHETQVFKVSGKHNNFYIFSLYRNPDLDDSIYDCLFNRIAAVQESDRRASFVFVGDLNAHHRDWLNSVSQTNPHGIAALDFSTVSGCEQLIQGATHRSGNCLDLLLTDSPGVVTARIGSPIGTSDHCFVSAVIKLDQRVPDISFTRKVFLKSRADWDGIHEDLFQLDWPAIYRHDNVVDCLNQYLTPIIERRVPSRMLHLRIKDKSWFNEDCRHAYHLKHEAYNLWRQNQSHFTWQNYVTLRGEAQAIYAQAEKTYNDGIKNVLLGTHDAHKYWSTIKSALFGVDVTIPPLLKQDGSLCHNPKEKAELLANVFDSKQNRESVNLPPSCFPEPKLTTIAFRSRTVKKFLMDLDTFGGTDPNGFFPLFFKKTSEFLAPKISVIFRKLIKLGLFSLCWRTGNVTPLAKGITPSSFPSEYRPITITPILSKIFERLLAGHLGKLAEDSGLLPDLQFGFRKGLGTCDALLTITHKLQRALDCGYEARLVGLDFSAAFDRVNHEALIFKLQQFGVGGSILSILSQFLSGRTQKVVVDGQFSELKNVVSGVPQGSVLGPLLFIIYTHDMWSNLENDLLAYADDATLVAVVPSPNMRTAVADSLNRDLAKISDWCTSWGMKLNPTKTQSMIMGRSRTEYPHHSSLYINGIALTTTTSFKVLGVTLDSKLTFEDHIRSVSSSVAQKIGLLRKSFRIFNDRSVLKNCFNSFILPSLEYCAPVWSSAADSHLKLLDRNLSAIKFLNPDISVNLWHRRSVGSLSLLFKIFKNSRHPLHASLPETYQPVRVTRHAINANSLTFSPIRCRTLQYSRSFIPATVKLWNELPSEVVESEELQEFKMLTNRFLIELDADA